MADKKNIQIQIDTAINTSQTVNNVGSLKKSLIELQTIAQNSDLGKDQQIAIQKAISDTSAKLGDLKNKLGDVQDEVKTLDGSPVERLKNSFGLLGEGIKNLDLDKVITGLDGITKAIIANPIGLIVTAVVGLVAVFGDLNKIMKLVTDVFAFALGPIQDLFDSFGIGKNSIDEATKSLDAYKNKLDEVNNTSKVTNALLEAEIKILEAKGATEQEVSAKRKQLLQDQLDQTTQQQMITADYIDQLKFLQNETKKGSKEYVEYQGKINDAVREVQGLKAQGISLDAEIRANDIKTQKVVEETSKKTKSNIGDVDKARSDAFKNLQERYKNEIGILEDKNLEEQNLLKRKLVDGEITEEEFNTKKLELNIKLNEQLKTQLENFILTEKEIKSIGAQNELIFKEQLNDDKRKQEASYLDSILTLNKDNDAKLKIEEAKRLKGEEDEKKKAADKLKSDIQSFENDFIQKKIDLLKSSNITEQELIFRTEQAEINKMRNVMSLYKEGSSERLKLAEEIAEAEKKLAKDKADYISNQDKREFDEKTKNLQLIQSLVSNSFIAITSLTDGIFANKMKNLEKGSKEEEKMAKKSFEVNKALNLSSAITEGILSTIVAWRTGMATGGLPLAIAQSVISGVTSLANIAKIASTKFQSKSTTPPSTGGGGSTPTGPSVQTPTFQPTQFFGLGQTTAFTGQQQQGATRVYVTEGDISNTQNRVRVVENRARFG